MGVRFNLKLLGYEEYRLIIADKLYTEGLISERLYEKCKKPSYITGLPYDLRTNDASLLEERMSAIEDEITRREDILKKADYRIGVKTRDSERLGKRVEKSIGNMDKAVENINKESDKIVKNITALEDKLGKVSFEDKDLEKKIDSDLKSFKKAHNNMFDDDLSGDNIVEYGKNLTEFTSTASNLHSTLQQALNLKLISKSDLNKADMSKVVGRIDKNIDKFINEGQKISKDVQGINDNQVDIDYISKQVDTIVKELDVLEEEFVATHNKYMENSGGPAKDVVPNPRTIVNEGDKPMDLFTFLPRNYEVYMVE